jgi:hypothetical protein
MGLKRVCENPISEPSPTGTVELQGIQHLPKNPTEGHPILLGWRAILASISDAVHQRLQPSLPGIVSANRQVSSQPKVTSETDNRRLKKRVSAGKSDSVALYDLMRRRFRAAGGLSRHRSLAGSCR